MFIRLSQEEGELSAEDRFAIEQNILWWELQYPMDDKPAFVIAAINKSQAWLDAGRGRKWGTPPPPAVSILPRINYDEYIQSDEWKRKAEAAKVRAGRRCQLCGDNPPELHAHHNTYDRLGHEDDADITVLCKRCHKEFHDRIGMPK